MTEFPHQYDARRLRQLVAEKCNGALSPEGKVELETLLLRSPDARDAYWNVISVHADLEWELANKERLDDVLERVLGESAGAIDKRDAAQRAVPFAFLAAASLAACILVAISLGAWQLWPADVADLPVALRQSKEGPREDLPVLGKLSALLPGSRWSFGRPGDRNRNEFLLGDTVSIDEGAAELRLTNDIRAFLEAPIVLQLVSVDRVRVLQGRIKIDVPKGAEGFTVETASAEVIDLGTSFSIEVANGGTDLVVFQGEVDLKVADQPKAGNRQMAVASKRFRTGEAVRVGADGTLSRIVNVHPTSFAAADAESTRQPVVTAVTDNIVTREDLWSFYEVVAGGMREDARAFVDRRHEWNGATAEGMPGYLVGGDYVKTFNNDKTIDDLAVNVSVNRPAVLYVLLDKRVDPPAWLVESFENTGDEIGIDEAWHDPLNYKPGYEDFAQIGPGKSIERTHSIWKLTVPEGGVVSLGQNGRIPGDKWRGVRAGTNMYGIVVVPL